MNAFYQTSICAKLAKMTALALVLVFCAFVSLSESACSITPLKEGAKHCVDRYDNRHSIGSTWTTRRCVTCTCFHNGLKCCDAIVRVTSATKGCIVKYDYKTCTFDVVHPKDPTIKCSFDAVGK